MAESLAASRLPLWRRAARLLAWILVGVPVAMILFAVAVFLVSVVQTSMGIPSAEAILERDGPADSGELVEAVFARSHDLSVPVPCACDPHGEALYLLVEIGDPAVPAIVDGIRSRHAWHDRVELAQALGDIGTSDARSALEILATDDDEKLAELGRLGLDRMQ